MKTELLQTLPCRIGVLFSPLLPAIQTIAFSIVFHVKKVRSFTCIHQQPFGCWAELIALKCRFCLETLGFCVHGCGLGFGEGCLKGTQFMCMFLDHRSVKLEIGGSVEGLQKGLRAALERWGE